MIQLHYAVNVIQLSSANLAIQRMPYITLLFTVRLILLIRIYHTFYLCSFPHHMQLLLEISLVLNGYCNK